MRKDRAVSPLVMFVTLAGVCAVVLLGGWLAVSAMSALYATPAVTALPPAEATATLAATPAAGPAAPVTAPAEAKVASATPVPVKGPDGRQAAKVVAPKPVASSTRPFVVVIDPGHQAKSDNRPEPIGPGASQTKPAVASGTQGVVTREPENVINLDVSLKLRDILARRSDVKVVMIRTTGSVDISNSQRAKIANAAHADVFIRLHCDGVDDHSVHGLLTLVPAKNQWTGPIVARSAEVGRLVQAATLKSTGARDRGVHGTADMSGFNWSTVPSVIVEMGVMTNPAEDRRLASASYQTRLAQGMSDGIVEYLHSLR